MLQALPRSDADSNCFCIVLTGSVEVAYDPLGKELVAAVKQITANNVFKRQCEESGGEDSTPSEHDNSVQSEETSQSQEEKGGREIGDVDDDEHVRTLQQ